MPSNSARENVWRIFWRGNRKTQKFFVKQNQHIEDGEANPHGDEHLNGSTKAFLRAFSFLKFEALKFPRQFLIAFEWKTFETLKFC